MLSAARTGGAQLSILFLDGVGFWVYVVLALAIPVHPDERQYMLRFRFRRRLDRRRLNAEHHAG